MKFYRRWQPVSALTFDLDDTLYDNRVVIVRAENLLLEWLAARCPEMAEFDWPQCRQCAPRPLPRILP